MSEKKQKGIILDRIKEAYKLKNNAELARFLGVKPNTISNWYARNSIDYDIIFSKCEGANLDWLINGISKSHIKSETISLSRELTPEEKDSFSSITEDEQDMRNIISSKGIMTLLDRLVKHSKCEYTRDEYSGFETNVEMINVWLQNYSLQSKFIKAYDDFVDNKISYKELIVAFKKDCKVEIELLKILHPYKNIISEIYDKISSFNDLHDRLFSIDDDFFYDIQDEDEKI